MKSISDNVIQSTDAFKLFKRIQTLLQVIHKLSRKIPGCRSMNGQYWVMIDGLIHGDISTKMSKPVHPYSPDCCKLSIMRSSGLTHDYRSYSDEWMNYETQSKPSTIRKLSDYTEEELFQLSLFCSTDNTAELLFALAKEYNMNSFVVSEEALKFYEGYYEKYL